MTTMKLKNGTEEATALVAVTMMHIRSLNQDIAHGGPICIYELVQLCKDSNHRPFGKTGDQLDALNLVTKKEDGSFHVHSSIRNIVLSAVSGDGIDMTVGNPSSFFVAIPYSDPACEPEEEEPYMGHDGSKATPPRKPNGW